VQATCAALVVGATSDEIVFAGWGALMFPLVISATGIFVCLVTHFIATDIWTVKNEAGVQTALKVRVCVCVWGGGDAATLRGCGLLALPAYDTVVPCLPHHACCACIPLPRFRTSLPRQVQIGVSTLLMTAALWPIIVGFLPSTYHVPMGTGSFVHGSDVKTFFCISVGLWGGCIIGFVTEYYTSFSYRPTQEVAESTETGAATNIIYGLALGYKSAVIPVIVLAVDIFVSFHLIGMYVRHRWRLPVTLVACFRC
jgi:Na+/H+-translocating membrane pyrophosphatase